MCRVHALRIQHDINISAIILVLNVISCHVLSALECTDLIQIARKMASDLSSLVFKFVDAEQLHASWRAKLLHLRYSISD